MRAPGLVLALTMGAGLAVAGCGDDSPNKPNQPPPPPAGAVPDFTLRDRNANSASFDQDVSPRRMEGRISAWYFGAAT